jgi:hypothetical protein
MSPHLTAWAAFASEMDPRLGRDGSVARVVVGPGFESRPGGIGPVLVTGSCGALRRGVDRGRLVLPRRVVGLDGDVLEPARQLADDLESAARALGLGIEASAVVEVTTIADDEADREALAARTGASFADQESAQAARWAVESGREWVALRFVTDTPEHPLAPVVRWLGRVPRRDPSLLEALGASVRRPWLVPAVLGVARATFHGRRQVARVVGTYLRASAGSPPRGRVT